MTLFIKSGSSCLFRDAPFICRYKLDFAGAVLDFSTEEENSLLARCAFVRKRPIRPVSFLREFLIPVESLEDDLFAHELYFNETTNQVSILESFKHTGEGIQSEQLFKRQPKNIPHWADLHWKTITYRRVPNDILSIEIHDKGNGKVIERKIWNDIPVETQLGILKGIAFARHGEDGYAMTMTDLLDCREDLLSRIHMFGNERFVFIWSDLFIYIMSFDPGFRFEYDHVKFPMD